MTKLFNKRIRSFSYDEKKLRKKVYLAWFWMQKNVDGPNPLRGKVF